MHAPPLPRVVFYVCTVGDFDFVIEGEEKKETEESVC